MHQYVQTKFLMFWKNAFHSKQFEHRLRSQVTKNLKRKPSQVNLKYHRYLETGWILWCPSSLRSETWLGPVKKEKQKLLVLNLTHNIHNLSYINILICWRRCSISSTVNFSRKKKTSLVQLNLCTAFSRYCECWQAKGRVSAPAHTASHLIRCGQNWSVCRGKQNYLWAN